MRLIAFRKALSRAMQGFVLFHPQTWLVMRLTIVLLIAACLQVHANGYGQNVSLSVQNASLENVLKKIKKQAGYHLVYREEWMSQAERVSVTLSNVSINEALDACFKNQLLTYELVNKTIVVKKTITPLENYADRKLAEEPQDIVITGRVTNEAGNPLEGVSIVVKGTKNGTVTDTEGRFRMSVVPDANAELVFSFIGYQSQTIKVTGQTVFDVVLEQSIAGLEDVVVVGYGTQKKVNLTGAISTINNKEITTTTNSSLAVSLSGKVPGLQIRQNTGEPGSFNTSINIRGFGEPLYVIDGIQQDAGGNDFQQLDPNDIESISIIKDASAAVYGLKSANGVVIVTTKKGLKGSKAKFNYTGIAGWQGPTDMPKMANRAQWAEMWNDAAINAGNAPIFTPEQLNENINGKSYDWYGATMKKSSSQQQHNISVSGGNDGVSYFTSIGYVKEGGLLKSNDLNYKKYNVRSNIEINLHKNWKAEVNISGRYSTKIQPSFGYYNIFYGTRTALPNSPIYANDDAEYLALQSYINPLAFSNSSISGYSEDRNKAFQSSVALMYSVPFLKGVQIKGLASYNDNLIENKTLNKSFTLYTYDASAANPFIPRTQYSPSRISNSNTDINAVTLQTQINYSTAVHVDHKIEAAIVYEQNTYNSRISSLGREYDFYTNDQINQAGLNNQRTSGTEVQKANTSLIGRFNYGYKDKYLIEYAFRYQGSYRYNPDKRWGFFPVVTGGWIISKESFMRNVKFVSNLKIRGSYGLVGEDAGNPFQYVQGFSTTGGGSYEFVNGVWTQGAASPMIVNKNLTWFTSNIKDIGIDLGLFNNQLNAQIDIYQRDRKGLLAIRNISLPNTFGGTLPQENLNSDQVRGIDFSIGYRGSVGDFNYGASGNFNFARTMNKHVESGDFLNSMDKWRSDMSNRWNDLYWGLVLAGQFQSEEEINTAPLQNGNLGNIQQLPGDYKYKDLNEDGIIDANDIMPVFANGTPKFYYGLTLNASWKRIDFNALFQGAGGYTKRLQEVYATVFAFGLNTPAYFYDRWHKADPYDPNSEWIPGKWPATRLSGNSAANYNESSIWRRDATFLRLKSVQVGYTLPKTLVNKAGIDNVRLYVSAFNILTFADTFSKPFDPEKIEGLFSDGFEYPLVASYNIGLNITF